MVSLTPLKGKAEELARIRTLGTYFYAGTSTLFLLCGRGENARPQVLPVEKCTALARHGARGHRGALGGVRHVAEFYRRVRRQVGEE